MKVEVIEAFRDAKTGEMHAPGRVLDVDEKRGAVMVAAGLAKSLEKAKRDKKD